MIENAKIGFRPGFFSAVKSRGPKKKNNSVQIKI